MDKKLVIIITISVCAVFIFGAVMGFLWLNNKKAQDSDLRNFGDAADDASKGVLPSIATNPLEDKPDLNPVDKANPIKNIKTNPFE